MTDPSASANAAGASAPPSCAATTAVLIACLNEEKTIGKVVRDFLSADPGVTVYVFDNASTDGTARVAAEAGATVIPEYRRGKGWVVRSMFRRVEADIYVMVDGDDTYPADEALAMRSYVLDRSADMVIGDRLSSTYFSENTRRFHGVGNRLVRFLVDRFFDSDLHDIMTGCRCMSREFVKTMPILSHGFEIETEMSIHALDKGFQIREVPVSYRDRGPGSESKLNTYSDGMLVLRTVVRLFRDYRPMAFFGVVGLFVMLVSLAIAAVPLSDFLTRGFVSSLPTLVLAAGLGITSAVLLTCGILLDSILDQARQAYEFQLTMFREQDAARLAERCPIE